MSEREWDDGRCCEGGYFGTTHDCRKSDDKREAVREPLVGYMILEGYAEDYSHWDGVITYPDPTGANLAWESPIEMIEKSAFDAVVKELRETRTVGLSHEGTIANLLEGAGEKLPEIYPSCAHPQSVWFDIHWRPRFEQSQAEIQALKTELEAAREAVRRMSEACRVGNELCTVCRERKEMVDGP